MIQSAAEVDEKDGGTLANVNGQLSNNNLWVRSTKLRVNFIKLIVIFDII